MNNFSTIEHAEKSYLDSIYLISHSKSSLKVYKSTIKIFRIFLKEKFGFDEFELVSEIERGALDICKVFQDFAIYLDKNGVGASSIRVKITGIKGYLRHIGLKINSDDLKQTVKVPRLTKSREIPLTKEIILKILRNANPKLQTAILVAISTGLRIAELVQIKISDVDFATTPTTIYIRSNTTKTKQSREVFLTAEATNALKDYLERFHSWDENKPHLVSDRYIFGPVIKPKNTKDYSVESAKMTLQEALKNIAKRVPDLSMKNENGMLAVHFHAFRKYFRTVVGNAVGRDFAEALIGHRFYMDTYYQLSDEKKREMYLQAEPYLTISDFKEVENNLKELSSRYSQLESEFKELKQYLKTMQ